MLHKLFSLTSNLNIQTAQLHPFEINKFWFYDSIHCNICPKYKCLNVWFHTMTMVMVMMMTMIQSLFSVAKYNNFRCHVEQCHSFSQWEPANKIITGVHSNVFHTLHRDTSQNDHPLEFLHSPKKKSYYPNCSKFLWLLIGNQMMRTPKMWDASKYFIRCYHSNIIMYVYSECAEVNQ